MQAECPGVNPILLVISHLHLPHLDHLVSDFISSQWTDNLRFLILLFPGENPILVLSHLHHLVSELGGTSGRLLSREPHSLLDCVSVWPVDLQRVCGALSHCIGAEVGPGRGVEQ